MAAELWRIRVLDYNGNVITDDLPHQRSKFIVWGYQPGTNAPTAMIGTATIPLVPPNAPEGQAARAIYDQLTYWQRVEIYNASGPGTAVPKFSGVITRRPRSGDKYELTCQDFLSAGQMAQRTQPFTVTDTADNIFRNLGCKFYSVAAADDQNTLGSLGDLPNGPGQTWSIQAFESITGARWTQTGQAGATSDLLYSTTQAPVVPALILQDVDTYLPVTPGAGSGDLFEIHFSINHDSPVVAPYAFAGLRMYWPKVANQVVYADAYIYWSNSAGVKQGGVLSPKVPVAVANASGNAIVRAQLALAITAPDPSGNVNVEMLLGGQEIGCVAIGVPAIYFTAPPSGIATIRVSGQAGTIVPAGPYWAQFNNFAWLIGANWFQPGVVGTPQVVTSLPPHSITNQSMFDMMHIAANQEQWSLRKTPKAGVAGSKTWGGGVDVVDCAPNVGTATGLRFVEDVNITSLTIDDLPDAIASLITVAAGGGSGNGPRYFATSAAALAKYGPITRQFNWEDASNFALARQVGREVIATATGEAVSKTLTIDNTAYEGAWRELDTIILHYPSLGIVELPSQVIGYEMEEGSPEVKLHLDQYPLKHLKVHAHRLRSQIDNSVAGGVGAPTVTADGLSIIDLNLFQGARFMDSQGNYRAVQGLQPDGTHGFGVYDTAGVPVVYKDGAGVNQSMKWTS